MKEDERDKTMLALNDHVLKECDAADMISLHVYATPLDGKEVSCTGSMTWNDEGEKAMLAQALYTLMGQDSDVQQIVAMAFVNWAMDNGQSIDMILPKNTQDN